MENEDLKVCKNCGEQPRVEGHSLCHNCANAYYKGRRAQLRKAKKRAPILRAELRTGRDTAPLLVELMTDADDRHQRDRLGKRVRRQIDSLAAIADEAIGYLGGGEE